MHKSRALPYYFSEGCNVMGNSVELLYSGKQIQNTVRSLARKLNKEYRKKNPVLLIVLKGSFIFAADLVRELSFNHTIEFVRVSSYGSGMISGEVRVEMIPDVASRHILIIEDIVDTGKSIVKLKEILEKQSPLSIKVCSLLDKPSRRVVDCVVDFRGIDVNDTFVVGYGLDLDESFRALRYIGEVKK